MLARLVVASSAKLSCDILRDGPLGFLVCVARPFRGVGRRMYRRRLSLWFLHRQIAGQEDVLFGAHFCVDHTAQLPAVKEKRVAETLLEVDPAALLAGKCRSCLQEFRSTTRTGGVGNLSVYKRTTQEVL